jgi:hypothetical protein
MMLKDKPKYLGKFIWVVSPIKVFPGDSVYKEKCSHFYLAYYLAVYIECHDCKSLRHKDT